MQLLLLALNEEHLGYRHTQESSVASDDHPQVLNTSQVWICGSVTIMGSTASDIASPGPTICACSRPPPQFVPLKDLLEMDLLLRKELPKFERKRRAGILPS